MQTLTLIVEAPESLVHRVWAHLITELNMQANNFHALFKGGSSPSELIRKHIVVVAHESPTILEDFQIRANHILQTHGFVATTWIKGEIV